MAATKTSSTRARSTRPWLSCRTGGHRLGGLVTVYKAPTAAAALELIAAVGRLAEEQNHHPDLDWRYRRVFLRYSSHDAGDKVTRRDVAAATAAGAAAAGSAPPRNLRRRRSGSGQVPEERRRPGP